VLFADESDFDFESDLVSVFVSVFDSDFDSVFDSALVSDVDSGLPESTDLPPLRESLR
jgi:hypothetical protein